MMWVPEGGASPAARAKKIASRALGGEYDLLLACRDLADLKGKLPGVSDEIIDTFVGVASEVDDLPLGIECEHWSPEALSSKDLEAAQYRKQVRESVEEALGNLLASLNGGH